MIRTDFDVTLIRATRHTPEAANGLLTFEIAVSRGIWTEVLTHRTTARNASSRRAMSSNRIVSTHGAWVPAVFHQPSPGMRNDGGPVDAETQAWAEGHWREAIEYVESKVLLLSTRVEKQEANRLLTDAHITRGVVTATEAGWRNFLRLRVTEHADRYMRGLLAEKVQEQIESAQWVISPWHTPYCPDFPTNLGWKDAQGYLKVGTGRIARTSFGDTEETGKEIERSNKMIQDEHSSPFEHLARSEEYTGLHSQHSALNCYPQDVSQGQYWRTFRQELGI